MLSKGGVNITNMYIAVGWESGEGYRTDGRSRIGGKYTPTAAAVHRFIDLDSVTRRPEGRRIFCRYGCWAFKSLYVCIITYMCVCVCVITLQYKIICTYT